MCKWYCMSEGPNTNLKCLHCNTSYCGACLYGDAGKMVSLIKCANCGKKPRTKTLVTIPSRPLTPSYMKGSFNAEDRAKMMASFHKDYHYDSNDLDKGRPSTADYAGITSGHRRSRSSSSSGSMNNVFDRLCDTTRYSGTHKLRFDEQGRGRGLLGRDSIPKGHVIISAMEIYQRAKYGNFN